MRYYEYNNLPINCNLEKVKNPLKKGNNFQFKNKQMSSGET